MLFVRTFIKNIHSYANVSSEPEKIPRIMIPIHHLVLIRLKWHHKHRFIPLSSWFIYLLLLSIISINVFQALNLFLVVLIGSQLNIHRLERLFEVFLDMLIFFQYFIRQKICALPAVYLYLCCLFFLKILTCSLKGKWGNSFKIKFRFDLKDLS